MDERDDVVARLTRQLGRAAALRETLRHDPILQAARLRLRAWQSARLARTHADLLADPRMGLAATFFLTDLYGAEDLAGFDAGVGRIVPAMKRLLPESGMETVAEAIELEALSEDLDCAMAKALGDESRMLTAATYASVYRKIGRRDDRERQITLIEGIGRSLDRLARRPLIGTTLSMMRKPAKLAGLGDLQDFLQRGYKALSKMGGANEFLGLVAERERRVLKSLFDGDDRPLGD